MFNPRLNLKNPNGNTTAIYLIIETNNQRKKVATGISIPPKFWNKSTMFIRENSEFPEHKRFNKQLKVIKETAIAAHNFFADQGIVPSADQLVAKYSELQQTPQKLNNVNEFWGCFDEFIEEKKTLVSAKTIIDYDKALRKHLLDLEIKKKTLLTFNNCKVSGNLYVNFLNYLRKEAINSSGKAGFATNSVGKQMKNLKSFLGWCISKEKCPAFSLSHIKVEHEEIDNVYLDNVEIESIINLKIDDMELEKYRDLFILGCETGLRFSDFSRIKNEHISNGRINMIETKTSNKIIVIISSRANKILQKYNYNPPNLKSKDLTYFNEQVREVCKLAGIDSNITLKRKQGFRSEEIFKKKYELISSHTCRRSFCTNRYIAGIPANVIMKLSGHRTEKAFYKYLKLSSIEVLDMYQDAFSK